MFDCDKLRRTVLGCYAVDYTDVEPTRVEWSVLSLYHTPVGDHRVLLDYPMVAEQDGTPCGVCEGGMGVCICI